MKQMAAWLLCAWVLWSTELVDGNTFFDKRSTPVGGFTNAEACFSALVQSTKSGGGRFFYRCLPDTVDLRGPTR